MSPKSKSQTDKGAKALQSAIEKTKDKGADTSRMAGAVARDGKVSNA